MKKTETNADAIIQKIAKKIYDRYLFTVPEWEAFIEDTHATAELQDELNEVRSSLMNYDEYKQSYIDGLIDEIDALVYKDRTCPICHGYGHDLKDNQCTRCFGSGTVSD